MTVKDVSLLNQSFVLANSAVTTYGKFPELAAFYAEKALEVAKSSFTSSEEQQDSELVKLEESKLNDLPDDGTL